MDPASMVKMMIDWQANAMCINHHQPSKPSNSELYQPDPARILRCIETYSYCYCMSMRTPHSLQVRSTCSADPDGCASAPEKRNESQWDQWAMFHIFHIRSQFLSLAHESGGFVYRRAYSVAGCEKLHPAACQSFKSVDTSRSFIIFIPHRLIISLTHREKGVDLLRPQLALKRLTCGGSAPQPELMRWFLEKSLGGDTVPQCSTVQI